MRVHHLIGGKTVEGSDYFETVNPATQEVLAEVASGGEAEVNAAVAAAKEAFPKWADTPAPQRAKIIRKLGELIAAHVPEISQTETNDTGQVISQTGKQLIPRAADNFSYFAEMCVRVDGHTYPTETHLNYTLFHPVGVCALVSPWNVPFMTSTWKVAPCLAFGNTAVLKMSELSPLTAARHHDLHERFTDLVALACTPRRILDLGCGFGKSTLPFCRAFPEARVEAVDLAAPCLKLAAKMSADAHLGNVRFAQADASNTRCDAASFDLVTSTMLLHELPPPMVESVLRESARVLKPGGWMVHLDFLPQVQPRGDAFAQFIHRGHGRRNNEPFMAPLADMDLRGLLESLGLVDVELQAFEEAEGALDPAYANWRFPWTVIRARKADLA